MGELLGIVFARDGKWAVTDSTNHCMWIFDKENQLLRKFGKNGTNNGEFIIPYGITFDANDHLYVTDFNNHWVQKFKVNGKYISFMLTFGIQGSGNGQLE